MGFKFQEGRHFTDSFDTIIHFESIGYILRFSINISSKIFGAFLMEFYHFFVE